MCDWLDPGAVASWMRLLTLLLGRLVVDVHMASQTLGLLGVHELVLVVRWKFALGDILDTVRELVVALFNWLAEFIRSVLHHIHALVHVGVYRSRAVLLNLLVVLEALNIGDVFLVALTVHLSLRGLASLLQDWWNLLLHLNRILVVEMVVLLI